MNDTIRPIAHIHTDFKEKFGIPRQSGRVPSLSVALFFCRNFGIRTLSAALRAFPIFG
jgi:hypothetical protein